MSDRIRCIDCKKNLARKGRKKCTTCQRGYSRHDRKYTLHKKDHCENKDCTATITHPFQLTVDHVDGDKNNVSDDNLVTLCANCHSLKTHLNRDYLNLEYR